MKWLQLLETAAVTGVDPKSATPGLQHLYYWISGERHLYVESGAPRFTKYVTEFPTRLQEWIFSAIVAQLPEEGDDFVVEHESDSTRNVRIVRLKLKTESNNVKLRIEQA